MGFGAPGGTQLLEARAEAAAMVAAEPDIDREIEHLVQFSFKPLTLRDYQDRAGWPVTQRTRLCSHINKRLESSLTNPIYSQWGA